MNIDFNRLERILAEAAGIANTSERTAYLNDSCGGDRELRAEVERLLAASQQIGDFLESPIQPIAEFLDGDEALVTRPVVGIEGPGTIIGRYTLLEEIGEGAFGLVYMAEQTEPVHRQVALKVVKAGMDTREVVARFEAERQALAMMDHPNIARVFDGGVTQGGRPYFVMELVRGIPITEFCDQRRLSTSERLRLFIQVCHAVQHAHQKGIIHRDLKPSNVLVTLVDNQPVPKVIDFGVAKALGQKLTDKTLFTGFLKMVGTPAYMTPEQADLSGVDIDTRSDIYALGVLLYELLTGVTPFDGDTLRKAALDEIRRLIRETEAIKPSSRLRTMGEKLIEVARRRQSQPGELGRLISGDLDWIVVKCLEKDRRRRYETANDLAADIERHLQHQPVTAAAPSTLYWAQKFIGRHKAGIAMAAALVLVLAGAVIVSSWQAQQARRARDLAQSRLYASQMKLAHAAIREGKLGGALALLNAQRPAPGAADFRGFDWRYLYGRCWNYLSEVVATNATGFQSVDFSPDGRVLAFGSSDGWVELFDFETRRRMKRWRAHSGAIDRLAFYPKNPQWLATASGGDHAFRLWDIVAEEVFFTTPTAAGMQVDLAFSPGGNFLVTQATNAQSLWLWEFRAGGVPSRPSLAIKENLDSCGPAAFSPDERLLALCNRIQGGVFWTTCLYDLADGTRTNLPLVHSDIIFAVAFSPDGSKLATAGVDERLAIWDVKRRTYLWRGRSDLVFATSLAFSRDGGTLFASGYDQNIRSWNVSNPEQVQTWTGHSAGVNRLAVAPDGTAFASAGEDGTGRLWHRKPLSPLSGAPPGEAFTAVFGSQAPGLPASEPESVWAVAVSPDQDHAAVAKPRHLFLCDLRTATCRTNLPLAGLFSHGAPVPVSLTYSPDGARLAVGMDDGRVILLDAVALRPLQPPLRLHGNQISHIAFALNGSLLATGGGFGTGVKLTDPASGRVHAEFAGNEGFFPMQPLAISPGGERIATGSPDGWVRIWDIASRRLLTSSPEKVGLVTDLAFSPEGKWLAISDARRSIFLWGLKGKQWRGLVGHTGVAIKLAFSPDGRTLASGGMDHSIRLWHPDIDREVAILTGHAEWIEALGFASGGNALLSGSRDGALLLWRGLSFAQIQSLDPLGSAIRRQ